MFSRCGGGYRDSLRWWFRSAGEVVLRDVEQRRQWSQFRGRSDMICELILLQSGCMILGLKFHRRSSMFLWGNTYFLVLLEKY